MSIFGEYAITIQENSDFPTVVFTVTTSVGGSAVDLTGYTAQWMVRKLIGDVAPVGTYTPALGGTAGTVALTLTAAQVNTLVAAMSYADGIHDVLLTSPGGVKTYLISPSKVAVMRSVTR